MDKAEKFKLKLNGKTCVMIDWANVYGWSHNLKKEVDEKKLYKYLRSYMEIGLDTFEKMPNYRSFIFFSGDGDYKTLYDRLLKRHKQINVIFGKGALGREIVGMKGLFLCDIEKNIPSVLKPRGVIRSIITKKQFYDN